jgi:hypothetical protein
MSIIIIILSLVCLIALTFKIGITTNPKENKHGF